MTKEYIKHYRTLGVEPGVSWAQLRKAYKSLVNAWHPDRFQQNARKKRLAEEKTKEITQSYQELAEYYKEFGFLPGTAKTVVTPVADNLSPQSSPDMHPAHENRDDEVAAADFAPPQARMDPRYKFNVRPLAAALLVGIAYLVWQVIPLVFYDNASWHNSAVEQSEDRKMDESVHHVPVAGEYFTVGAPPGEVYSIQGVPTKTEQDTWYYGKSRVHFSRGKVLHWEEDPGNPLKAKITLDGENTSARLFGKGSSKNEVLAIQGKPDRDAGNVWEYGVSRVYFDNDRVKGWDDSPFNPLKVRQ